MKVAQGWRDYTVIATGDGMKLEQWAGYKLLRPDPQVIWKSQRDLKKEKGLHGVYERSREGGGAWNMLKPVPEEFKVNYDGMTFSLKLMGFKHTGLFPEQAVNWRKMQSLIKGAGRPIKVLNLFGYTGGATVACCKAGASVCHVDAAVAMVDRCKRNMALSGLQDADVRYIVDDCIKFCERELRRGKRYDAVILDPPSFGRGPKGEKWKIEDSVYDLVELISKLLTDNPLFVLLNSYTTGLQPTVMENVLRLCLKGKTGTFESDEIGIETLEDGVRLPCGASAWFIGE